MRLKTSHQLLLIGLSVFLGAVFLSGVLLKQEFQKTDLSDPMRNFEKIPLENFDRVYLETGKDNQPAASLHSRIRQGEKPALYFDKGLKDSMQWSVKDGVLQIKGYSQHHQTRQRAVLVIDCPNLVFLETQAAELKIDSIEADSFVLRCLKNSQIELKKARFQKANFEVAGFSSLTVGNGSDIQHLHIGVKDRSSIDLIDVLPISFTKMLDPEASVSLKGKALALFK
jgi:Putative auto-transporter adhesin, head GIN domain